MQRCTVESPVGNTVQCGDTERERDNAHDLVSVELGTMDNIVVELPSICPPCGMDVAVSSNTVPTTCWELPLNEACVPVSPVGDNILH